MGSYYSKDNKIEVVEIGTQILNIDDTECTMCNYNYCKYNDIYKYELNDMIRDKCLWNNIYSPQYVQSVLYHHQEYDTLVICNDYQNKRGVIGYRLDNHMFIFVYNYKEEKEVTQLVNTILTDYLEKDKIVSSKDIDNYLMNIKYNSNINQIFYSLMKIDIDYLKDVQFSHFKTENIKYF